MQQNGSVQYAGVLKNVEIFRHLPPDVVERLASKIVTTHHKAGEAIIHKNDPGDSMYIIVKGRVKVHDGEMVVAEMGGGSFFGEFSLLDDEPRSMSVSALTDTETGVISRDAFYEVLNIHPDITRGVIKILINRLRRQNGKIISEMTRRAGELEKLVEERTIDLSQKNVELADTLATLRHTQEKLVMQEKLATLGQLTAGIAHEIRNPLNFVNNFTLLSSELMDELKATNISEEQLEIVTMVSDNLQKVTQHGKRADQIVKSMMQHARDSSAQRTLSDINRILVEAIDLAYHGLQSGEKNFDIIVQTALEPDLPPINLVPQDLNRVFLNLISNSFYALKERVQKMKESQTEFKPVVRVTSKLEGNQVVITIHDNGTGIPPEAIDKIFNPFFTSKPTGQGTGLGLSISNDIIKAHGGQLQVNTKVNEFTEFSISLPVEN